MTIDQKYASLGGPTGFLGSPTTPETVCPDQTGHFRHYQNGSIYRNPATDAHEVHGAIRDRWSSLGWEESWLGYPTSDEGPEGGGGRISQFQNGFIDWSPAKGAVDRFSRAFQAYDDVTFDEHQASFNKLRPAGWRMSSLCVYGGSPLYAAVWVLKGGPEWSAIHGASADQWQAFCNKWTAQNFRPTLVSASGSGSSAVFAAVMEKTDGPIPVTRHGLTPADFVTWCQWATLNGFMLTTAALYGDSGDPRIIAVWDLNRDNTTWSVDNTPTNKSPGSQLLESFDQSQAVFNAEVGHDARVYHIIPSGYSQWLAAYRGDSVGPGQSFTSLSADDYKTRFDEKVAQGFYPDSLHVGGNGSSTFGVIFTKRDAPLPKRWVATGSAAPTLMHFDEAVQGYMQRNSIRGGSLAIAQGSKLVYAKAFTWAEPGYPIAQPTDLFRVGSDSKCLTSILIHQLLQDKGLHSYDDLAVEKLALTPPPQQKIVNGHFAGYTIWHLLCHQSGIAKDFAWADAQVVGLFGEQLPASSKWEIASWLLTQKSDFDPPGKQFEYANSGYLVLAAVVEKLRGVSWFQAFKEKIMTPLGLKHCVVSGSLLSQRAPGEVLYHNNGLTVATSVMTPNGPLVHNAYGDVNLAVGDGVGGMALAAADYVKIMAALELPSNPVLQPGWVNQMWSFRNTVATNAGYGYGWGGGYTQGGAQVWSHEGALDNCHTFVLHRRDGYSVCMAFNTGQRPFAVAPDLDDLIDSTTDWPTNDLFPSLGIPSF